MQASLLHGAPLAHKRTSPVRFFLGMAGLLDPGLSRRILAESPSYRPTVTALPHLRRGRTHKVGKADAAIELARRAAATADHPGRVLCLARDSVLRTADHSMG